MDKIRKKEAIRLFKKFHNLIKNIGGDLGKEEMVSILAKKCALIAVDEMIRNDGWSPSREVWAGFTKGCDEIKKEIEKI